VRYVLRRELPVPKARSLPPTKDGGTLRTIGEACDFKTRMGNRGPPWPQARRHQRKKLQRRAAKKLQSK